MIVNVYVRSYIHALKFVLVHLYSIIPLSGLSAYNFSSLRLTAYITVQFLSHSSIADKSTHTTLPSFHHNQLLSVPLKNIKKPTLYTFVAINTKMIECLVGGGLY